MKGSFDAFLASPADFAGADDIITNLTKKREPWIKIIDTAAKCALQCVQSLWDPFIMTIGNSTALLNLSGILV